MRPHPRDGSAPPRPTRRLAALALPALLVAGFAGDGVAQGVTTGAVAGRVVDGDGAPVAAARVQVRHEPSGVTAVTATDSDGRFFLPNLRPGGPYTVDASRVGLSGCPRENVTLRVGETLRLELVLGQEAVRLPELRVALEADPDFNPSRTGPVTRVDEDLLARLPSIDRDFLDFSALSPLARVSSEGISVAGQNLRFNSLQVDGALSQDVFGLSPSGVAGGRARARPIPLDAVQQFQILVAPFDVRQSGFTGGVLNAVTRSGTNRWEAGAFATWRDEGLAGDLTVDGVPRAPEALDDLHLGATLGGPIVRDRAHLFAAAEVQRRRRPPSGFDVGRDDPLRTGIHPDSARRLEELLSGYGVAAGSAGATTLENELANVFVRVDAQLGLGHRLVARHNWAGARDDAAPNRLPGDAYELSSAGAELRSSSHSTVLELLSDLGGGVSNDLLVNLQFLEDDEEPVAPFPRVEVDVTSTVGDHAVTRRLRAGADLFAQENHLEQRILQVTDNLALALGSHRLVAGASLSRFAIRRAFLPGSLGSYRFESLAALERNEPVRYDLRVPLTEDPAADFSVVEWAAWAQDEWTVTDRLTLRGGLRVDVPVVAEEPRFNDALERDLGVRNDRMPSATPLWSPRVGFNLRLGEEGETQLRGGAGLFTGRPPFAWLANAFQRSGRESVFLSCADTLAPGFSRVPPGRCADGSGPGAGRPAVAFFAPDFRFPRDLKLTVGVDRALPLGLVGTVEALYARAVDQVFLEDINLAAPVADPRPEEGYSEGFGFGTREAYGTPTPEGFVPGRVSDRFGPVVRIGNASDNFAYALSAELRRRFGDRFDLRAGYAYSRSVDTQSLLSDDATTNFGLNPIEGDPNDPRRQPSLFDRPHKLVAVVTARLLERFGGTRVSVLYVGQSGRPYSYVYRGDVNGDGYPGGGETLDLANDLLYVPEGGFAVPGGIATKILTEQLIAIEECLAENRGRILHRNACRAPWSNRLDLRLTQHLPIDGPDVQVGVDVVNVLNLLDGAWGRLRTMNPAVRVLALDGRNSQGQGLGGPTAEDPLEVRYVGAARRDAASGGIRATLPTAFDVEESLWQAQLGVRVQF